MNTIDVCIRGQGPVGRTLALSLAKIGLRVGLLKTSQPPQAATQDVRTYALNARSVELLRDLRVWDVLMSQNAATAVYDMRVAGDEGGLLEFSAWQQQVDALAWIVDAAALDDALNQAVKFSPHIAEVDESSARHAALTAICEGKASAAREALGVTFERQEYHHHGVACRVQSDLPHQGRAWQWFGQPDILALLPFDRPVAQQSYGVVWSVPQERAKTLMALDDSAFNAEINDATSGAAGQLMVAGARMQWPLALGKASHWFGPGWVLLGDAAHQIHPLSGQGLNLGLSDVITLASVLKEKENWRSLGDEKLLNRYAIRRSGPTQAMEWVTDGLWHLFSQKQNTIRLMRNQGLSLVNRLGPLKHWLASQALKN